MNCCESSTFSQRTAYPLSRSKGPHLPPSPTATSRSASSFNLDILIRKQDLFKARELLTLPAASPCYLPVDDQEDDPRQSDCENHLTLQREDGGSFLELHWELLQPCFGFPLRIEDLGDRLTTVSLAGRTIRSLPAEELLLFLCAHGAKHNWLRLGWICDIAELIRTCDQLDWQRVLVYARALGGLRMLALGLFLGSQLLGADPPQWISRKLRSDSAARNLTGRVIDQLFRDDPISQDGAGWGLAFYLEARERLSDRIRCARRLGGIPEGTDQRVIPPAVRLWFHLTQPFVPNALDRATIPLPAMLSPLHYLLRPLRLIATYGRQRSRSWGMLGTLLKPRNRDRRIVRRASTLSPTAGRA